MEIKKYSNNYVKSFCTMISRGDILNIQTFLKYLEYVDLNTPVEATSMELDMLFANDSLNKLDPKYYILEGSKSVYSPTDLILYSFISNENCAYLKEALLREVLKIESLDFSDLSKTLSFVVSKGDLKLFNLFVGLNPDFNVVYSYLKTGEKYSLLDNCISLAMARLTINNEDIFSNYPKEILDYLLTIDKSNINFEMMIITKLLGMTLLSITGLSNEYKSFYSDVDDNLLEDVGLIVNYYIENILNKK